MRDNLNFSRDHFICNGAGCRACRGNSCSSRDSWLCSPLLLPSSFFFLCLFVHVFLRWLVTSWDEPPLRRARLADVASPPFRTERNAFEAATLLNKKCPMKQVNESLWSFALQHDKSCMNSLYMNLNIRPALTVIKEYSHFDISDKKKDTKVKGKMPTSVNFIHLQSLFTLYTTSLKLSLQLVSEGRNSTVEQWTLTRFNCVL